MKERTGAEKRSLLREVAEERVLRGNGGGGLDDGRGDQGWKERKM